MEKEILIKVLQIDSLSNILSWYERVMIHLLISQKSDEVSERIVRLYNFIIEENWECPKRNYDHDRVLYFFDPDSDTWLPDDYYLKINTHYNKELTLIKKIK